MKTASPDTEVFYLLYTPVEGVPVSAKFAAAIRRAMPVGAWTMTFNDVTAAEMPVQILTEEECWSALMSASLGRLAVTVGGVPDIFPVNFVAADRHLFFRTAPGTKLVELTVNNRVAFETDGVGQDEAWSVVIHGKARALSTQREIDDVAALPLRPLIPTVKAVFVEIVPQSVTGRRFTLGPEPSAILE
jgi:hypothetical protein